ncbi:MAG: cation-transporting P-type ATPase [Planctomycetaceae bacterium]
MSESPIDRVLEQLATSEEGLTAEEAAARLQRYGLNRPPRPARSYWLVELAKQFMHLFAALLWTAAMLAWFVDMSELAMAVVAVILINGTFSYWQQFRAEQAVAALESLLPRQVSVRRNGREETISAEAVALGEILLLTEGSAVPADARLIQAERLRIDVSSLTGESRPVSRMTGTCTAQGKAAAEISNIVLAGSFVSSGRAEAVVFRTGIHTEFGRLAALTHLQPNRESPLQREMKRITRLITLLAVGMGLLFFGLGWGLGRLTLVEGFLFALGIIVANVPEGLLPTISLALAIGVRRMAGRHAIVKRLEGVETLGAITVIITDKTGTLTHNQMTVRGLWCAGRTYDVSGDGYEPAGQIVCDGSASPRGPDVVTLLRTAALCSDASLIPPVANDKHWTARGDPTEAALLVAAAKADVTETMLRQHPRVVELPFDSVRKRMTTIQQSSDELLACMKGAPNEVAPRCTSFVGLEGNNDACRDAVEEQVRMFADRGWRVLAIASRKISDAHRDEATIRPEMVERDLTFLGLIAMEDPPRAEVPAAVVNCRSAGIRIIMATGDDGRTAAAIAREIGLLEHEPRIISGSQLDEISDHALGMLLGHRDVLFARVNPSQKLRLVEALQQRGEVVAVTGDGVNDAPALKRADIGVAMGASGTDVARAAADMILLDDNFATIVAAIEEGRAVYENVRKFVTYIFASNVPEIVPFIAFVLFRIPLPLTVMQILAVDLGTDLLPALALGVESPETDTMHTPPRARTQPLLDRKTLLRAYGWLGAIEATLCLCGFFFVYLHSGWRIGNPMETAGPLYTMATTMSLAGIVACQLGNGLACRSERKSIFTLGLLSNRPLIAAMFLEVLILLVLVYIGPLAKVFGLAPLQPAHWGVLFWFGPVLLFAEEVRKWHLRRQN